MVKPMETKQQIRKRRLICREEMDETAVRQISAQIGNRLWEYFDRGQTVRKVGVYGYYPHRKEVDLTILYQNLLQANVPLAFPRVSGETMEFFRVRSMEEDFEEGAFHIMEPRRSCSRADFYDAVCLIPGSVFDRKGNRYGYGRGYYDRYLSLHPPMRNRQKMRFCPNAAMSLCMRWQRRREFFFLVLRKNVRRERFR